MNEEERSAEEPTEAAGEKLLTLAEASKASGLHKETLGDALRSGELKGRNLGGRRGWMTTWSAIKEWIESGNAAKQTAREAE